MKITIDQAEIETAIKAHIASQVSVKEGMTISVDLRATRGETGMQANITIAPEGEVVTKAIGPVAARQTPAPTVAIVRRAPLTAVPTTQPAKAPEPVAQAVEVEAVEVTEEMQAALVHDEEAGEGADAKAMAEAEAAEAEEEQPVAAAPVAAGPTKSLFGGLRKPVNRPTAA